MNDGKTVFSQLIGFLPDREFRRCVARYHGDRYTKTFSCWEQFLALAFAQLAYRESLRDIEACLGAIGPKLYHMGFSSAVARSTLADANESRNWRIFADFAQVLIRGCMDSGSAEAASHSPTVVQAAPTLEPQENGDAVGSPKQLRHSQHK
jgi:hypothetical protein